MTTLILKFGMYIVLSVAAAFLWNYCYDAPQLWKREDGDFRITPPSLMDACSANVYVTDRYVQQEVCTAYFYFVLRNELHAANQKAKDAAGLFGFVMLQVPMLIGIARSIYLLKIATWNFACIMLSLAICILCVALASFVYRRYFKLRSFAYTRSQLENMWSKSSPTLDPQFGCSNETDFNAFCISMHLRYLLSVKDAIRSRRFARRIVAVIAGALYVLLVLPNIEP